MPSFSSILSLAGFSASFASFASLAAASCSPPTLPLPQNVVTQFPLGSFIENLAVRSNGDLLLSMLLPTGLLYYVSNPDSRFPQTKLVHNFTEQNGVDAVLGITEIRPDVFLILGSNTSAPGIAVSGTGTTWTIDLTESDHQKTPSSLSPFCPDIPIPKVRFLTNLPQSETLNGATTVPGPGIHAALVADSTKGVVWRVDTLTGHVDVAVKAPELGLYPGKPVPYGVNGLHVQGTFLYWTNSALSTVFRVRINAQGYRVPGSSVEKVFVADAEMLDDFTFDEAGNIWVATNRDNRVLAIDPTTGRSATVEGAVDQLTVIGDTSCRFGRTDGSKLGQTTLYVTTGGGLVKPINGTVTEGAKVVAVDTRGFQF